MVWNFRLPHFESKHTEVLNQGKAKCLGVFKLFPEPAVLKTRQTKSKKAQHRALKQAESMAFSIISNQLDRKSIKLTTSESSVKKGMDIFISHAEHILCETVSKDYQDFNNFSCTVSELLPKQVNWLSMSILFGVAAKCSQFSWKEGINQKNQHAAYVKLYLNSNRQLLNFVIQRGGWENSFERRFNDGSEEMKICIQRFSALCFHLFLFALRYS